MDLQQQQVLVDRALTLVRQQVETDPVDFVEFMLKGVGYRDLDAIADDIVCFVLRMDDICQHVKDRLKVQQAYVESHYDAPAADPHLAAAQIVKAIRAIVAGRL